MSRILRWTLIASIVFSLAACGNKGPLVLPAKPAEPPKKTTPVTPTADPATPATAAAAEH